MAERTIGNYVLGPILGRGGMSCVHAAEHRFLGDRVAIKLLRAHLAADPEATTAFLAEATRTRAIDHPNVVRVLDFGSDGDDLYLVMERLDGESLAARLARAGRLDEPTVRRLGAAIADGVAAAHDRGIIHRDLKPGNVMLAADPDGAPKLVDFGIARHLARGTATVTGSRVGTLAYMAPEQLAGGLVAPCNDVWSLGVLLFEALTGELPFADFTGGRTPQLVDAPPPLAALVEVSPALDALVAACLARDPGQRPPSMQAIAEALRAPATDQRFTEELPPAAGVAPPGAMPIDAVPGERAARSSTTGRARAAAPAEARRVPAEPALAAAAHGRSPRHPRRRLVALATALVVIVVIGVGLSRQLHDDSAPVTLATLPAHAGSADPHAGSADPHAGSADPHAGSTDPHAGSADPHAGPAAAIIAPTTATVEIRSVPTGASVLVGGKRVGVTPTTLALALPASIVVTRAGYQSARVRAEHAGALDVRLARARPIHHPDPAPHVAGETLD